MHSGVSVNTHGTRVPLRREAVAHQRLNCGVDTNKLLLRTLSTNKKTHQNVTMWSDPDKKTQCTEKTPMQQNVDKNNLCYKMCMLTSDSPNDTKFIFVWHHRGTSRQQMVVHRDGTNQQLLLRTLFSGTTDFPDRACLSGRLIPRPISPQTLQKFLKTKTRLRCPTVFRNFTRFPL